ncbi:hypothetical protein CP985_11990 [Malaciobacter mytili LMG 24559]|uniref:AAA+ ATPase domain-containing protein n=1 Tax=Malaciobacter mytili LMG 24559 TaxID=1032238 RepID=A0AAX2AF10_9BACT|nr:ATP-binding protein [Malaciobacter mytili]AXH15175.1 ATP-binding protein (AAA domain) [Malaciobacter mytili LMG 24559]RXK14781.1 hypothetical protein CP985_11990 [Malaciobacter mytili LMG 24559]
MYKIKKLNIKSFKFFKNTDPLLFNNKNILIYGENGSGKSTIYWALYTFFQSSIKEDDLEIKKYFTLDDDKNSLINIYEEDENNSKIELLLNDESGTHADKTFTISKSLINTNKDDSLIKKGCYTGDFISYKYLFRFFDFLHKEDIDLFKLFEYEIFHSIIVSTKSLAKWWDEILKLVELKPKPRANRSEFTSLTTKITQFNSFLQSLAPRITQLANEYLEKFSYQNLNISIEIEDGNYTTQRVFKKPKIKLNVELEKSSTDIIPIKKAQSFFNEAKLTAIALSIRFAITKIKHIDSSINILVLDDLLVSLDMSNREKFLSILLEDDLISRFQIIILTHDKAFYEKSRELFKFRDRTKWKYFEMYLDIDDQENIEQPFIKEYGEKYNNLTTAKQHFENKDYPACANYLRKEVEWQFDKYLQLDNLDEKIHLSKIKSNHDLIKKTGKLLKDIVNNLKCFDNLQSIPENQRIDKCTHFTTLLSASLDEAIEKIDNEFYLVEFENIRFILKNVLHPQSHNDLTRPLYKVELERALSYIEEFDRLITQYEESVE